MPNGMRNDWMRMRIRMKMMMMIMDMDLGVSLAEEGTKYHDTQWDSSNEHAMGIGIKLISCPTFSFLSLASSIS
jgi:hypothetical protein